jgi:hypothetical protein
VSVPNVVARTRTYLVFEQMLEFTLPVAGRYALAIESGQAPEPPLPSLRRELEIYPRVVIETVGTSLSEPRAVFRSYTTTTAGVGTPGDSLGAITIGTDTPGAQVGGGTGITLRQKPDLIGPAAFVFGNDMFRGSGAATAFAGGAAVILLQARTGAPNVFCSTGIEQGKALEIPSLWLKTVPPAPRTKP